MDTTVLNKAEDASALHRAPNRPHPASLPPPVPLSKKRGWVPADTEPSCAATIAASSNGYLDTPAKYRSVVAEAPSPHEVEDMMAGKSHALCPIPEHIVHKQWHRNFLALVHPTCTCYMRFSLMLLRCLQCCCLVVLYSLTLLLRIFMILIFSISFHVHVDLPPAKRRRTLAGSIVSTAVSAALIGTAVGLTVYRL